MDIRSYTAADESAAISLWNDCLTSDTIDKHNFYKRIICDVNFDPSLYLVAEENGELLGFVYGTKRRVPDEAAGMQQEKAWIAAMGVGPKYRRKGVGAALLADFEAAAVKLGAKTIDVGPYPGNYFFPGVDESAYAGGAAFFTSMGYVSRGTSSSMDINLQGYKTPERYLAKKAGLETAGYRFGAFEMRDCLPVFDFLGKHFPYWLPNVRENILQGRGEETIQLAWDPNGEAVGFAMRAMDGTPGRFGPFGVASTQQGTGLGGILFHNLVTDMVKRRIFYTWFLWTGGRNLDIYGTWGMKIYRTYVMMGKEIK